MFVTRGSNVAAAQVTCASRPLEDLYISEKYDSSFLCQSKQEK